MRGFRALLTVPLLMLAPGCSEIKSLAGSDEGTDGATITLSAASTTVEVNAPTGISVQVVQKNGEPVKDGTPVEITAELGQVEPAKFRTHDGGRAAVTYHPGSRPGTERLAASSGKARAELTLTVREAAAPPPPPPSGAAPLDLSRVIWLHTNVAAWPETSRITKASIGDPPICIHHTKAGKWPVHDGTEGNPWIFVNLDGKWYAATYEWLRPGQICKAITAANIGPHTKRAPLSTWRPKSGELVGLMVSARARARADTVRERSNVVMVRWP